MAGGKITVFGAGSVGCYVGGSWKAAGLDVSFVGRERLAGDIAKHGLTLSDSAGWSHKLEPGDIDYQTDPAALGDANIILLCVKSGTTDDAAAIIRRHAKQGAVILSFQNGIANVWLLKQKLEPEFDVVRGMVPFNVAYLGDGRFHKGVAGVLRAEDTPPMQRLARRVASSHEPLLLSKKMVGLAWGKLVINLNNAVNALSGRSLSEQLGDIDYRRVVAASQAEALKVLKAAGIKPERVGPVPPNMLPRVLASRDWIFKKLFARGWRIDDKARSSMADDLAHGRKTEIEALNGEVVALADEHRVEAPVNRRIVELVRRAEEGAKPWEAAALAKDVLGRR
jgi:2-dehydropantoate 2-reductase